MNRQGSSFLGMRTHHLVIALIAWQVMYRIERAVQLPSLSSGRPRP